MNQSLLSRISGILLIGVFLVNVYLGLYDTNLSQFNPTHYYLNWVIAIVSIVGAGLLLSKPRSRTWVLLAGIIWPIVYVISLAADVETRLCAGAPSATDCWPSHTAAFDYLILNYANIPNAAGFGWKLLPVIPVALVLLLIVFILSIISLNSLRKKMSPKQTVQPPAPSQPPTTSAPGPTNQPRTSMALSRLIRK